MHTIELLEQSIDLANDLGYGVRQEWMGGCGGGACEIAGRKWIFVDLSLTAPEQLEQILVALRNDPSTFNATMSAALQQALETRRAA
jgi:hypothetical protein